MSELEGQLEELERAIHDSERQLKKEHALMPQDNEKGLTCYPYTYIIAVLIPIITIVTLYLVQPKWVAKKEKGKYIICWRKLFMWVAIISLIAWVVLYLMNYCGAFDKLQACF